MPENKDSHFQNKKELVAGLFLRGHTEMLHAKVPLASAVSYDVCKAHGCSCGVRATCVD